MLPCFLGCSRGDQAAAAALMQQWESERKKMQAIRARVKTPGMGMKRDEIYPPPN